MATQTITCTNDTYITMKYPSTSYATSTYLQTIVQSQKWSDFTFPGISTPLLQFTIPDTLKYKKITKAILNVKVHSSATSHMSQYFAWGRYDTTQDLGSVTYSNYQTNGTFSSPEFSSPYYLQSFTSDYSVSKDVTNLFQNGVLDGKITFAVMYSVVDASSENVYICSSESTSAPTLTLTYEDVLPKPATLVYPIDTYINESDSVRFKWVFNSDCGAKQKSYVLKYKKQSESTWTQLSAQTTANEFYNCPANTFTSGIYNWWLTTTDETDQTGDAVTGTFTVRGKPQAPTITSVKNDALTEFTWNAEEQVNYTLDIYKNGLSIYHVEKSSNITSHKANLFLANGSYEVRIKYTNTFGYESGYGSKTFTISATVPTTAPTITASFDTEHVTINATYGDGEAYLFREDSDGVMCIAKLDETQYLDYNCKPNESVSYFVRLYNGGYVDSTKASGTSSVNGFVIVNGTDIINLTNSTNEYMDYQKEVYREYETTNYSGRAFPVTETGEHKSIVINRTAYVRIEDYDSLEKLFFDGTVIMYRDDRKNRLWCRIDSLKSSNAFLNLGYTVSIKLIQVDYSDEVVVND